MAKTPAGIVLTPDQRRRRRARNIAVGFALGGLVILFYVITVFKLGGAVANRAI